MLDKNITINDVARLAGVSKRTVSRVINRSPLVSENTLKLVEKVIEELSFIPDKQARGLASSRSYLLGLIYDNPDALYIDQVQRGVLDICTVHGYELVVHPCHSKQADFIEECVRFVSRSKLDGVIILPPVSENRELAASLRATKSPYVRIASVDLDDNANIVISDERQAMKAVADLFVELGHKNIGYISGPLAYRSSIERMEGFMGELDVFNLKIADNLMIEGKNNYESGKECARTLLSQNPRPTAILANNDEMAAGVLRVASEMGIRIPQDLSVAGFDDNILASRIIPSLTTIRRPVEAMASLATQKLINAIEPNSIQLKYEKLVIPHLVVRESTGPVTK